MAPILPELSIGSLLLVAVCSTLLGIALKRSRRAPHGAVERAPTTYQLAYLAGGPHRVVTTALAAMAHVGVVRAAGEGRVTATPYTMRNDPIESAVVDALRSHDWNAQTAQLRYDVGRSAAVAELASRLTRQRLLVSTSANRFPRLLHVFVALASLAAGAAAVIAYIEHRWWPAGTATAAVVCGALTYVGYRSALASPLTDAGRQLLARSVARHKWGGAHAAPFEVSEKSTLPNDLHVSIAEAAMRMGVAPALFGPGALSDPALREALTGEHDGTDLSSDLSGWDGAGGLSGGAGTASGDGGTAGP